MTATARHNPPAYDLYHMSRPAFMLLRDRADWEFAKAHDLHPFFCETYLQAIREQAAALIAEGFRK